jgi:hypothetical protein
MPKQLRRARFTQDDAARAVSEVASLRYAVHKVRDAIAHLNRGNVHAPRSLARLRGARDSLLGAIRNTEAIRWRVARPDVHEPGYAEGAATEEAAKDLAAAQGKPPDRLDAGDTDPDGDYLR